MRKFTQQQKLSFWLGLLLMSACGAAAAQQMIANPLVRPAIMPGSAPPAAGAGNEAAQNSRAPEPGSATDPAELRRQAERRITQEDLNIRQQSLNSPVLPLPLQTLFANMQVTAYFQGAIVMRRVDTELLPGPATTVTNSTNQNNGTRTGEATTQTVAAAPRVVSRSSGALRLRVGRTENISGYKLRARVDGQDISVDWLNESGMWVNVFFGALESSPAGVPLVPDESQLQKVETEQFKHLVPVLRTQTFSPSGSLGGQPGGNQGAGFGGFGGNFGGGGQPGFGTGFPN